MHPRRRAVASQLDAVSQAEIAANAQMSDPPNPSRMQYFGTEAKPRSKLNEKKAAVWQTLSLRALGICTTTFPGQILNSLRTRSVRLEGYPPGTMPLLPT